MISRNGTSAKLQSTTKAVEGTEYKEKSYSMTRNLGVDPLYEAASLSCLSVRHRYAPQ